MKKLFISCLVLLGSLSAQARYHDEIARIVVNSTCTPVAGNSTPGMTCTKNAVGNTTITFNEAFTQPPACVTGIEAIGSILYFSPSLVTTVVNSVGIASGLGIDANYSIHCFGL